VAEPKPSRADVYARVTAKIVDALERGAPEWEMPWHAHSGAPLLPTNALTGRPYRGVNVLSLWAEGYAQGFPSAVWATFNQWLELGHPVRKGERAAIGVLWKPLNIAEDKEDAEESERQRWFARAFPLFNAHQVEGYAPPRAPHQPHAAFRVAHAERFFGGLGLEIYHGGHRALYAPTTDRILMPTFEAFHDPLAYYGTLAHEATHWTGHPTRLARDLAVRFGSDAYAMEELIAELGAAFVCADLALTLEARMENAAYLQNWLRVLKADSQAIFAAAGQAQRAADYMHGLQPEPAPDVAPKGAPTPPSL
jgi:antirestriction protein ArdC